MPDVVAHGHKPDFQRMWLTATCRMASAARKTRASPGSFPLSHREHQVADFRSGNRRSSEPRMGPPANMVEIVKAAPDPDVATAAGIFSSSHFQPWIASWKRPLCRKPRGRKHARCQRERRTASPSATRSSNNAGGSQPHRASRRRFRIRRDVPPGSVKKGEELVTTGGGRQRSAAFATARPERPRPGACACRTFAELLRPASLSIS